MHMHLVRIAHTGQSHSLSPQRRRVGCEGCVAGVNLFTTPGALVVHAKAWDVQVPSVLLAEQSDDLVDLVGNIAECRCRFKHFRANLAQLVVEHDFDLEESKDQKQDEAIVAIDYKVLSIEEEESRRRGARGGCVRRGGKCV